MAKNQTFTNITIDTESDLYYGYICPFVGAIGVLLNLLVFLIFSSPIFKEILYKYLKLNALFIGLDLLFTSFRPVFYWKHLEIAHSYPAHLYEKYLITYGASVVEMTAFVCLVLATFNYYLLIDNLLASQRFFFSRVSYIYVCVFIVIVSILLFFYQLFEYKIVCDNIPLSFWPFANISSDSNNNQTIYMCNIEYESFHYSTFHSVIEILAFFIRDGLNLILLILLNLMIFVRVKKGMNKKKSILNNNNNKTKRSESAGLATSSDVKSNETARRAGSLIDRNHSSNKRLRSISKTKYKLTIMVIMSSVNCALGRLPIMIFFIIRNFGENEAVLYFRKIAVVFVYLSYDFNFFFLYFTNKKFKMLFNRYFLALATCNNRRSQTIRDRSVTMDV